MISADNRERRWSGTNFEDVGSEWKGLISGITPHLLLAERNVLASADSALFFRLITPFTLQNERG
jgi:hypothetical protein